MNPAGSPWYVVGNVGDIPSPSLLVYAETLSDLDFRVRGRGANAQ
jgi:hypothetical protein